MSDSETKYKELYEETQARLETLIEFYEKQLSNLEAACEEKCRREQIDRLVKEYEIPHYLLQTSLAKQAISDGDLDAVRRILEHRARLLRPKLILCETEKNDDGKEKD